MLIEKSRLEAIEQVIQGVIARESMLLAGRTVVVGLSGGADSVALTHFLFTHREQYQIEPLAAHLNHGLRGEAANRDQAFTEAFCNRLGVPLRISCVDVAALAKERGLGLEDCGRQARYGFFQEILPRGGRIATAHTRSDSVETVLLNLARGAGARGLCGIPARRGNVVRPLVGIGRGQVEEYCAYYHLEYIQDESNFDRKFARNSIRLDVVPLLRALNPAFEESVARTAESLAEDDAYLRSLAGRALAESYSLGGYRLDDLRMLPEPVLRRAVMLLLEQAGPCRYSSGNLEDAVRAIRHGGGATMPGGIQIAARGNTLCVHPPQTVDSAPWQVPLTLPETALPDGRALEVELLSGNDKENTDKFHNLLFNNLLDYATISNKALVRSRKSGDRYRQAGRGVTKSLKKLFCEEGVALSQRERRAVLEQDGEILWVEGFGPSEKACPQPGMPVAEITIREKRL